MCAVIICCAKNLIKVISRPKPKEEIISGSFGPEPNDNNARGIYKNIKEKCTKSPQSEMQIGLV